MRLAIATSFLLVSLLGLAQEKELLSIASQNREIPSTVINFDLRTARFDAEATDSLGQLEAVGFAAGLLTKSIRNNSHFLYGLEIGYFRSGNNDYYKFQRGPQGHVIDSSLIGRTRRYHYNASGIIRYIENNDRRRRVSLIGEAQLGVNWVGDVTKLFEGPRKERTASQLRQRYFHFGLGMGACVKINNSTGLQVKVIRHYAGRADWAYSNSRPRLDPITNQPTIERERDARFNIFMIQGGLSKYF